HYYSCTQALRLTLPAQPFEHARHFLPGGAHYARLLALLRIYLDRPLTVYFEVGIKGESIPPLYLGGSFHLGHSSFLLQGSCPAERTVRLKLNLKTQRQHV
ncbi:MAG: type VI secretion system baseplate subunit TssG, partial [Proteobacteria bacterium]|nr:type VI secretion system baseplate subunit TssG [Candidatus Avisuccinivibrio stercorigallinarum]